MSTLKNKTYYSNHPLIIVCIILCSIITGTILLSCKTLQDSSDVEWFWNNNTCDCNDMNCWNEKTDKGMKGSLKCAANALLLASGLKFLKSAKQIIDSSREITTTAISYDGDSKVMLTTIVAELSKQSAKLKCTAAATSAATSVLKVTRSVLSVSTSLSTTAFMEQIVENNTLGLFKNTTSLTKSSFTSAFECLQALGKSANTPTMKFLAKIVPPLKVMTEAILVPYVLIDCGISLTKGTISLFYNSQCGLQDLKNLSASYDRLYTQKENIIKNASASICTKNPINCNNAFMLNYGIKLYMDYSKEKGLFKENLASRCYKACVNMDTKKDLCKQATFDIYTNEPESLFDCVQVCNTEQCSSTTEYCVSYCCNQDATCIDKVKSMQH